MPDELPGELGVQPCGSAAKINERAREAGAREEVLEGIAARLGNRTGGLCEGAAPLPFIRSEAERVELAAELLPRHLPHRRDPGVKVRESRVVRLDRAEGAGGVERRGPDHDPSLPGALLCH